MKIQRRRARYQTGSVYERCDKFFVRYYTTIDGKRVQRSEFLHDKDAKHDSPHCKAVKKLRDDYMRSKEPSGAGEREDVQITEFWEKTYLPFVQDNLRASTVSGYKQIWTSSLKDHFAGRTLREYRTHHGSEFLTALAKTYGRRTLAHIRSLASGLFTHAINVGLLESNVWHDVKILTKVRKPGEQPHYTLAEIEDIISALVEHVDCQLIMALSFFVGLRPSEIAGLRFEDFDSETVHIRRACVRSKVDECKTPESQASLPLLPQVLVPLALWRQKRGKPSEGWVFENERGKPAELRDVIRRKIMPALVAKGLRWKGLYAGRRGAGTILVGLTGNLIAAQELLRHKSPVTTGLHYKLKTQDALATGMKLLGEAANK